MICGRCEQPIKPRQAYDTFTPDSGSGAAATVYLHRYLCQRAPRQTAPESIPR